MLVETTESPKRQRVRRAAPPSDFRVSRGIEQRTFRKAAFAGALEGMTKGMISLNAYVALVAMGATAAGYEAEVSTLITMLPSVAMLFAAAYNSGGHARKRRGYFLFAAFAGHLIFLVVPLLVFLPGATTPFAFVGLVALSALICAGVPPALNQLWGANYLAANRGRNFAWISSVGMFMVMVSAFVAGAFLDAPAYIDGVENWQLMYPAAAFTGALAMIGFYSIRMRYAAAIERPENRGTKPAKRLARAYVRAYRLLRDDGNFFRYEAGFFLYGIAFMMMLPAVPVLFSKYLSASYSDFSQASVVTMQCTLMVMAPLVAWFAKGRRVTVVTTAAFLSLMLYPAMLTITAVTREIVFAYAAFVVFGLAMSGVHFVWNLGPVTFARGSNPLPYTSTHATLVGARSLVGFPLSYLMMKLFPESLTPIFVAAGALLLCGAVVMIRLDRRMVKSGLNQTT